MGPALMKLGQISRQFNKHVGGGRTGTLGAHRRSIQHRYGEFAKLGK